MSEKKFRDWVKKEIETEAAALENKIQQNKELSSLEMPDDSCDDLMRRIREKKEEKKESSGKHFRIRPRVLLAAALAAVLLAGLSLGAAGERLFTPEVKENTEDGEYNVDIVTGDEVEYLNVSEEEAYEEIEERIGIQALRLGYKPEGMDLEKVFIDENMGEAQMEFDYDSRVFTVYENKQNTATSFNTKFDGEIVDDVDAFYLNENLDIIQIDKGDQTCFWAAQLKYGNGYYNLSSDINLQEFKNIISELYFKSV